MALAESFNKSSISDISRKISQAFFCASDGIIDPQEAAKIPSPVLNQEDIYDTGGLDKNLKSAEDFALLYEELISYDALKKEGVFYTPIEIADLIIEKSIKSLDQTLLKEKGLIDPACGGGIFLVRAYRVLCRTFDVDTALSLVHGIDRDPLAVEAAKLALVLAYDGTKNSKEVYLQLGKQIFSGNSLVAPSEANQAIKAPFDWSEAFDLKQDDGFACIIGNPPYGLSRNEQISTKENELLKSLYAEFRVGKVNKYLLFIARSFQFLAEGGVLSFIIPNSWLGIRSGSAIRELLLNELDLNEISFFDGPVFPKASVETIVFRAKKGELSSVFDLINRSATKPLESNHKAYLTKSFCIDKLEGRIPLVWDNKFEDVLETIYSNSIKISHPSSGLRSYIALQAYAVGKGSPAQTKEQVASHCFHSESKDSEDHYPYLAGNCIERYKVKPEKNYLKYGPWLAEPQVLERFQGPRIAVREIINRTPHMLNAAYLDHTALYNKSVLHILPQKDLSLNLMLALTGVLNSSTASLILLLTGRKTQRALFPKIVNADLLSFPVPVEIYNSPDKLASLVDTAKDSWTEELQNQIDLETIKAYGLSADLQPLITRFISQSQDLLFKKKSKTKKTA